jgi:protein subunit release factor B
MLSFAITEMKQLQLRERMAEVGIREEDLDERFVRSSGSGGQHVNKSSTCVQLIHKPTSIEVKCMQERSQSVNRFLARRYLVEKVALHLGLPSSCTDKKQRIKRRKSRRKRRLSARARQEIID